MAGKTTIYLRNNPAAKAVQDEYRRRYNKLTSHERAEHIKENKKKGSVKGDGLDLSKVKGGYVLAKPSNNRGGKGVHKKRRKGWGDKVHNPLAWKRKKKKNPRLKRKRK